MDGFQRKMNQLQGVPIVVSCLCVKHRWSSVKKPQKSQRHSERSPQCSSAVSSFKQKETSNSSETSKSSEALSPSLSKQDSCKYASATKVAQGTLETMVERENVLLAEIRWVLKVV